MAKEADKGWLEEELRKIPERAKRASPSLRAAVAFPTRLRVTDAGDHFLEWSGDGLSISPYKAQTVECTIGTSLPFLRAIANHDLNPQIALLSGKVKVEGTAGVAIYFFNLLAV